MGCCFVKTSSIVCFARQEKQQGMQFKCARVQCSMEILGLHRIITRHSGFVFSVNAICKIYDHIEGDYNQIDLPSISSKLVILNSLKFLRAESGRKCVGSLDTTYVVYFCMMCRRKHYVGIGQYSTVCLTLSNLYKRILCHLHILLEAQKYIVHFSVHQMKLINDNMPNMYNIVTHWFIDCLLKGHPRPIAYLQIGSLIGGFLHENFPSSEV